MLDQGAVVESGTHFSLLEQDGIYKSLYQNKFNDSSEIDQSSQKIVSRDHLPSFTEEPVEQGYLIDAWYKKSFLALLVNSLNFYIYVVN